MKKFIVLIICIFLCGCDNYAELNRLSIVTAMSIDKIDDKYEVSLLIANSPKADTSSKEGEAKTTVYKGLGKSVSEAIKAIDRKNPKELYFSHINVVVISDEVGKNGFFKIADWLIRHPQTRNEFYLLEVNEDKASNVLKIISPLESFPSQSIATLIESNKNSRSIGDTASYSNFIGRIMEEGYEAALPTIKINGSVRKGSKQENLETAEPSTYLSLGPLAIYRGDKLIDMASKKDTESIYIIDNEAKELVYTIKYKNNYVGIFSNTLKTKIRLNNDNEVSLDVSGSGTIYEINGDVDLNDSRQIKNLESEFNKCMKKDLYKVIRKMQNDYKSDIFGFGNMIYKNYPNRWKKIKNDWNEKYFKNLKVKINTDLYIESTGSLNKTLEGER